MQTNYTPSVNIVRDQSRELHYLPTPNSIRVAEIIGDAVKQGGRSFNLIGSYGTGKSSFLWAFERSITEKQHFFQLPFEKKLKVEFINFVGEYKSLRQYFAAYFGIEINELLLSQKILAEIYQRYHNLGKGSKALFLVIDEFGKFLEYAAKNNPEEELYFLQQLAEFANNPDHSIILITTVHQNFDAYSYSLSSLQQQEWSKVKGRFREIAFNETVEQLLYLASERVAQIHFGKPDANLVNRCAQLFQQSRAFPIRPDLLEKTGLKLYPLDLLTANLLTIALQRYGQNERSLFSFLESPDHTGLRAYDTRTNPFYNLANAYNYLIFNFYSYLTSRHNVDMMHWSGIKNALDKVENEFKGDVSGAHKLIKTIGLLHLFAQSGSDLNRIFLIDYASVSLGIEGASDILAQLETEKVILYRNHHKRFILSEGTDVDIHSTLKEAEGRVGNMTDIASLVEKNYNLQPIFAKSHYYKTGTPRLFEFKISNRPLEQLAPQGETDGFVNLVFNDKLTIEDVIKASIAQQEAVIYGFYQNSRSIKDLLFEIEKTKKAIETVHDRDKVARREFESILSHQQSLLSHYILNNLYNDAGEVLWVFNGVIKPIENKRAFNMVLSEICDLLYPDTPAYKNELVNRHKLPPSLFQAKRSYLKAMSANWGLENLGFDKDKFPPEKTIFITLLRENSLVFDIAQPAKSVEIADGSTFTALWSVCNDFLDSTRKNRRRVSELLDTLSKRPFKIKQGLVDFWLPSFLFIKRNDFALFYKGIFIPHVNDEILELISKDPQNYEIKAFDLEGVRLDIFNSYRTFLNQTQAEAPNQHTFIETIKPFLVFYTKLPEYAKHTKRLSKEALSIRNAIATSTDPEKTFFEDFPLALGYSTKQLQNKRENLEAYTLKLQDAIREIRTSFDELVNRYEAFIQSEIIYESVPFVQYQSLLQERYKNLKKHLLLPNQKTFVQRLYSELDDRRAWLGSLAQSITGKNIETFRDEDELLLYDKFKTMATDLDNLTNISKANVNEEKETVFQLEISSFEDIQKRIVRLPKKKQGEINTLQAKIKAQLGTDSTLNVAALMQTLQELIKK